MRRPKYRLSPNEVERMVKEDQEQRRKLRIVQVREQSKANAAVIRNDVRRERERLLNNFAATVKEQLEAEKEENIRRCEQKYESTLRTIGEGHKEALIHGDGLNRAEQLQKQMEEEAAAQERFKQALERQRQEDSLKEFEKTKHILARQAALLAEKQRAMEVASLPPPPPDISVELEKIKKRAIPMVDMKAFATTHYHIPDYHVVRAGSQEQLYDAKSQAEDCDLKLKQDLEDKARSEHAQLARARIRGNEALQKELLKHDYADMLKDLSLLQKKDRRQRRKMLSQIPKQVFIPPEMYLEEKKEKQYEMERKFNEIYMDQLKMERDKQRQADVSNQIVSHEFEAVSSPQTAATIAEDFSISMSRINPALRDLTNQPQPKGDSEGKKPDTVLKQLLNRIKEQRDDSGASVPVVSEPVPSASTAIPSAAETTRRPVSGGGVRPAVGNKAVWVTTQDDSPGLEPPTSSQSRRSQDQPVGDTNMQPQLDNLSVSENEKMIEDLRRRIELIQSQKEDLAQQLKAQLGVCGPLGSDTDGSTLEGDEEGWTLEEVDIDAGYEVDGPVQADEQGGLLPLDGGAAAASAWLPPLGSGWGSAGGSHLIADVGSGFMFGARRDMGVEQPASSLPVDRGSLNTGPVTSSYKPLQHWDIPVCMRSDLGYSLTSGSRIHTRVQQEGNLLQGIGMSEGMKFTDADFGSAAGNSVQKPASFDRVTASSLGYGTMGSLTDESTSQGQVKLAGHDQEVNGNTGQSIRSISDSAELARKVQEYRARAMERQASMDAETLGKVRAYQHQVMQTYDEKKKYLADIKADIEKRQQELSSAASSKPAFSLESMQILPSETGWSEKPVGKSLTVAAGQKVVPSGTDGSSVGRGSCEETRNVQMFETRKTSVAANFSAPIAVFEQMPGNGSCAENVGPKHRFAGRGQEEIQSQCQRGNSNIEGKYNTDKVRKSLSFDEEFMKSGNVSWNDVTDADMSKCSQDSRVMSSEEERGSPVLPQGHAELSDKPGPLPHDRAYLYGSVLLAQAQERKLGFEHRQLELQNQLLDIQRQKDAIMQAYYTGQTALQQREKTLISKMATASALLNEDSNGKQREEVRAKLASIRSQIDTDARSKTISQEGRSGNVSLDFDHLKESRSHAALVSANCSGPLHPTEQVNDSTDMDRTSSRQSLGNRSMPGNISSDSFLAEISFHKIRSDDGRSLPSSAFHVPVPSSTSSIPVSRSISMAPYPASSVPVSRSVPMTSCSASSVPVSRSVPMASCPASSVPVSRNESADHQQAPQTWASILSTSVNCQQQAVGWQQNHLQDDGPVSQDDISRTHMSNTDIPPQRNTIVNQKEDFQNIKSLAADVVDRGSGDLVEQHQYTSSLSDYDPTDHQPHELSTILEVDTPGSVSAMTSSRQVVTLSDKPTATSDIINTKPSQGWSLHRINPGVRVDVFAGLPYIFPETRTGSLGPGAVYHLQPGHTNDDTPGERSGPGLRLDTSTPGGQKQTTAKRSLDFSDNLYVSNLPALVELSHYRVSDIQAQEGEESGQDHFNTDRTLGHDGSTGDDSSLRISGFSDYMRLQEFSIGRTGDDYTGTSAASTNLSGIDEGNCMAADDNAADRPKVLGSLPHNHGFDPNIVERLQQQSRAMFGDMVVGEGSEASAGSLLCSSLSCDLEEVSIPQTGN